jgi:hypothetical protein
LVPNPSESEDCTIIDVEDYKATSDVPMFVQHTEAMLEEIYRMVFSAHLSFYLKWLVGMVLMF